MGVQAREGKPAAVPLWDVKSTSAIAQELRVGLFDALAALRAPEALERRVCLALPWWRKRCASGVQRQSRYRYDRYDIRHVAESCRIGWRVEQSEEAEQKRCCP